MLQHQSDPSMSEFAATIFRDRYAHDINGRKETWAETAYRVAFYVLSAVNASRELIHEVAALIEQRKFMPGGRYLAAAGRELHQTQNCVLLRAEDSREGWGRHISNATLALMTGAGVGGEYSRIREEFALLRRTGGYASGPIPLIQGTNEMGRAAKMGGSRRAALWAGLKWKHPDALKFAKMKDWPEDVRAKKAADFNYAAPFDHTNISLGLDDEFFAAHGNSEHPRHAWAREVYKTGVHLMLSDAEPGFSVDCGENEGEDLRNACTEITSRDDSDICNLGSINMARIGSVEEMRRVVELATIFLLAGTVYSDVPYAGIAVTREKNRRLGLGLMGLHEWLLVRGLRYEPSEELIPYLDAYAESTRIAWKWADMWGISRPVKTRAIAPTGTIGIVAETTTGLEPIFCAAYMRRYFDHGNWLFQYVLDPTARRLVEMGVDPDTIEDAYMLSQDCERRISFQAWIQQWVDHGISSTLNLPAWGTKYNNPDTVADFSSMLLRYLPKLRGITCYPDGCRGGQPLTPISYAEAANKLGVVHNEQVDVCSLRGGGSCGV